jgi:replicative DNA helicase
LPTLFRQKTCTAGLMLNAQAWDKVADVVSAEDLYRKDHQLIFKAIARLVEGGSPCDVVTVSGLRQDFERKVHAAGAH